MLWEIKNFPISSSSQLNYDNEYGSQRLIALMALQEEEREPQAVVSQSWSLLELGAISSRRVQQLHKARYT